MGLLRIIIKLLGAEGCRGAMRLSYIKHLRGANQGIGPKDGTPPYWVGLYGALASRYKSYGVSVSQREIWQELVPFLLMTEQEAPQALAEYVLYKERPNEARVPWLQNLLNNALRRLPSSDDSSKKIFASLAYHNMVLFNFLDRDTREIIKCSTENPLLELHSEQALQVTDPLREDMEQYALKTQNLLVKEHVLDTLTLCIREAIDSEKNLISIIEGKAKDLTTENLVYQFLSNFNKRRSQKYFLQTLRSDIAKINLSREYRKLISAYEDIFPLTEELEKIHEKKIELLDLFSQCSGAILKSREAASKWVKDHPNLIKESQKNSRALKKLYAIKKIDLNRLFTISNHEKKKLIAILIWSGIFGKVQECPEDLLRY
jgi:hypothetical protein